MIRLDPSEEASDMGEEKRFYYLRLMAKPGGKPIKTKFVTWSADDQPTSSTPTTTTSDDPILESQAMRVVRTIGQAFEVCHKVAQEQMQEKHEDEAKKQRSVSVISEEDNMPPQTLDVIEETKGGEESSRSSSPIEPPAGPLYSKRMSLFQPRKASSASSSAVTVAETTVAGGQTEFKPEATNPNNPILQAAASATTSVAAPSTTTPTAPVATTTFPGSSLPTVAEGLPQQFQPPSLPSNPIVMPFSQSATLPHSRTWAASQPVINPHVSAFPSAQSLDTSQPQAPLFYPMIPGSSASLPFGLQSPVMVSPYATLQLNIPQIDPNNPDQTVNFNRSLEQYNQQLIRSQLDQAQQSAQVAGCQVQLLREQLTSETTARLEAQSRTHQLLNANRELLEQVQNLVQRLQHLETKITGEIQQQVPSTTSPPRPPQATNPAFLSYHEQYDARLAFGNQPVKPNLPYQVQPLADLRAGSLPPSKEAEKRKQDDGNRTEPESNNEDTTDYSSSDQYERTTGMARISAPSYNVLMSNPLADLSIPSYAGTSVPTIPSISQLERRTREDDDQQPGPSSPPRKSTPQTAGRYPGKVGSILRGEKEFSRMSFNPRIREKDKGEPELEDVAEEAMTEGRRDERRRRDKVTVESLFSDRSPERTMSQQQSQSSPQNLPQQVPASSSIVTSMYPPIRKPAVTVVNRPKIDVVRTKMLRTLSVTGEADEDFMNQNKPVPKKSDRSDAEDILNRNVGLERSKASDSVLARHKPFEDGKFLPNGYP